MCIKNRWKVWIWTGISTVTEMEPAVDAGSPKDSNDLCWKVHSFGYHSSTAILRWFFFIRFLNFSLSFQANHPVLPIQPPPSNYSFAIASLSSYHSGCFYSTQAFCIDSSNQNGQSLQHRNNQATGNSRTCSPAAEDEIKCQSSAEGCVSKFLMSPTFKKICDPLLPIFN